MGLVRLTSVWIKRGHFAYAKPCGKAMDKSRKLDIDHSFSTLDHPLTTLRQVKFFRKLLTKNSATAIIFFCKKSPSNRMENCLIFTCFLSNDWGSPYAAGRCTWRYQWVRAATQLPGIPNGLGDNLASVGFNITFSSRLGTLAIPVAPTAAVEIVDDSVELIDARIVVDDVSHRFNANAFPDTPADFRHGQHVVGADRRLCILQSGALGRAWRLNCRRRGALRVAVALRGRRRTV